MSLLVCAKHVWGKGEGINSILLEKGAISAVGPRENLAMLADSVIEYPHDLILPGFCDAHLHLAWLGENLSGCDLRDCSCLRDFGNRLTSWADSHQDDDLILGYGWDERTWADPEKVTSALVDRFVSEKRVFLVKVDGHSYCANKRMMDFVGLAKQTPDPPGGRIDRDSDGNPTGLLFEKASGIVYAKIGKDQKKDHFKAAFDHLLSLGITSVRSFGSVDNFLELGRMASEPEGLPLRVCACIPCEDIGWAVDLRLRTGSGSDTFWVGQIKMFADGSLGSRTANISRPYPDGTTGIEVMTVKEMAEIAKIAHENRMGVAIHAIGDAAGAKVARVMKNTNYMDTVEHLQCAAPETIKDLSASETPVIVNPCHIPLDAEAIHRDWKDIAHMSYPISSLLQARVPVGFGSDAPVATANPFYAIACAATRKGISTRQVNPKEAISFSAGIDLITERSARIIGGPKRGKLDAGYMADFVIAEDFRGLDPWECVQTRIVSTWISGRQAWPRLS